MIRELMETMREYPDESFLLFFFVIIIVALAGEIVKECLRIWKGKGR